MSEPVTIQEALCKAALDAGAIPKDDTNAQQGFKYRGIDRIMANLGPAMSRNGIVPMPRVVAVERESMERGGKGAVWRLVTLTVEYEFTGPAGDKLTAKVMGEGLDNADKATSKAFTMAQKTCYLQVFKIGDGSTDPDGETPPEQQSPSRPVKAGVTRREAKGRLLAAVQSEGMSVATAKAVALELWATTGDPDEMTEGECRALEYDARARFAGKPAPDGHPGRTGPRPGRRRRPRRPGEADVSLHAPGVRSADGDLCHCSHMFVDHYVVAAGPEVFCPCDVPFCLCRDYEADGYGPDPDDRRDA